MNLPQTTRLIGIAAALACAGAAGAAESISATLNPTQGNTARGTVVFTAAGSGKVKVDVQLTQLPKAGEYGMHIHEKGDCSAADATSAGPHFNPTGSKHGSRTGTERHAGDLGNVKADDKGAVRESFDISGITLDQSPTGIAGRSVVLHAKADDLTSQPAGESGARIACGAIGPAGTGRSAGAIAPPGY